MSVLCLRVVLCSLGDRETAGERVALTDRLRWI